MVVELDAILEPDDVGPRLSGGHADEDDLVAQHVLVVEVGGLRYSGTLKTMFLLISYKEL